MSYGQSVLSHAYCNSVLNDNMILLICYQLMYLCATLIYPIFGVDWVKFEKIDVT